MKIVPVMDIRGGVSVHARAGDRTAYAPLRSVLSPAADEPVALAEAYRNRLGLSTVYVADLDGILEDRPDWRTIRALADGDSALWVDAGVRTAQRAVALFETGVDTVIIGFETLSSAEDLREIVGRSHLHRDRFLLSLDLFEGRLMFAEGHRWPAGTTWIDVVRAAADLGLKRFLILDVARVGTGRGPAGVEFVETLLRIQPSAEIWLGGGVRSVADLVELGALPIAGVLVASALHDGSIGVESLVALARNDSKSTR